MEDIFEKVSNAVKAAFSYSFHFQRDPDADDIHYVRMYGVPDALVGTVRSELFRLIDDQVGDLNDAIIPSICSLSNTIAYHSEYLLRDPEPVEFQFVRSWNMTESYKEIDCPCRREAFASAA